MGQDTQGWAFCPTGWAFSPHKGQDAHFGVKIKMSFYFYRIIYFTKKIFAYQEFDFLFVIDQFQKVSSIGNIEIWASILRMGVLSNVTLPLYKYRKIFNIRRAKSQNFNNSRLVLQLSLSNQLKPCRCTLSREWRYSWSSADRRCSNYIWVMNKSLAY